MNTNEDDFQNKMDEVLSELRSRCLSPTLRFLLLFNALERRVIGIAIGDLIERRRHNELLTKLEGSYLATPADCTPTQSPNGGPPDY